MYASDRLPCPRRQTCKILGLKDLSSPDAEAPSVKRTSFWTAKPQVVCGYTEASRVCDRAYTIPVLIRKRSFAINAFSLTSFVIFVDQTMTAYTDWALTDLPDDFRPPPLPVIERASLRTAVVTHKSYLAPLRPTALDQDHGGRSCDKYAFQGNTLLRAFSAVRSTHQHHS
jgi:hypothetical protein